MAARGQNFLRRSLQVHEILSALECEEYDNCTENIIYVEPPIEHADQVTDEDSDKSDEEHDTTRARRLVTAGPRQGLLPGRRDSSPERPMPTF
ncbi:unnamed protein product, partial [Iphiclides podalirius]